MRTKAISNLNQAKDTDLFRIVSEGMSNIIENSSVIFSDAQKLLGQDCYRGYNILRMIASEEAAKFMILLDAVRCDRSNSDSFSKQLKRYNDHLSKGIYSEYYEIKPSDFQEVQEWVDNERQEFYLDGPNDVDWIFPNCTLHQREEKIYVDYIEIEDKYQWSLPENNELSLMNKSSLKLIPKIIQISTTLYNVGISDSRSLEVIAHIWRPIKMDKNYHWYEIKELNKETLINLESENLLKNIDEPTVSYIIDNWLFPIYSLDTRIIKVEQGKLKDIQNDWSPW